MMYNLSIEFIHMHSNENGIPNPICLTGVQDISNMKHSKSVSKNRFDELVFWKNESDRDQIGCECDVHVAAPAQIRNRMPNDDDDEYT